MLHEDIDTETDSFEPCKSLNKFKLGDHAEVTVVCALPKYHDGIHLTIDNPELNTSVTFRWFG